MQFLRMLADAAFFYAMAGLIAASYGASGAFVGAVVQSLCFALSWLGGDRRSLRLALLLPMGLCWYVYRDSPADCILLLPVGIYVLWLVWQGDYALSHDRQSRLFPVFLRVLAVFAPVAALMSGGERVAAITVPLAMVCLTASVLLLRALRHEPRVYCEKKYQLVNLSAVAAAAMAAWLLSSEPVIKGCAAVIGWIYNTLILPILILLLQGGLLILRGVAWLLRFVRVELPQPDKTAQIDDSGVSDVLSQWGGANEPSELLRRAAIGLAVVAAVVLLIRFFRWLNRKGLDRPNISALSDSRDTLSNATSVPQERDSSPVRSIRAQYRKFLKLCAGRGVSPERSDTSLDVDRQARRLSGLEDVSGPIREIYIRARYSGRGGREELQQMKQLYARAKKEIATQK